MSDSKPVETRESRVGRTYSGHGSLPKKTNEVRGRCSQCQHEWVVAYLPMELEAAAKLMQAASCPKGCDDKVLLA